MKRTIAGVLFYCLVSITASGQEDSSFHNYLYDSRTNYFNQLPPQKKSVIFFGDSITQWGDWSELFGFRKILNRGIAGDNTYGLLARIDEIIRHDPKKIFILVGTNDLNKKSTIASIVRTYGSIIDALKKQLPATKIYVQSVLPINEQLINRQYYSGTNEQITDLNTALKGMAASMQVTYVDLYNSLLDDRRQLKAGYTYDGLHLSGNGYLAWVKLLTNRKLL
ncbi:MAG: family lipase [Ferruginibacter sp.]|nr:family lipase [Ferruginibacter sp.]